MENNYYIYSHINPINGEVFYIGKGSINRAYSKNGRSIFWKNYVNKYGIIIEIIENDLTQEKAFELEKHYISKYGRRDLKTGTLVNMTDGGEGGSGIKHTDENKKKISERMKGHTFNNGRKHSDDFKTKISERTKGENNPMFGKVSAMKDKNHSEESKIKMINAKLGSNHSDETKEKISIIAKERFSNGFIHPKGMLGKKISDEQKEKFLNTFILKSPAIYSIDKNNIITEYTSIYEALSKNIEYKKGPLYSALKGYKKSYKGLKWFYKKITNNNN